MAEDTSDSKVDWLQKEICCCCVCKDTGNAFTGKVVSQTGAGYGMDVYFNDVESEEDKGKKNSEVSFNKSTESSWIGFKEGTEFAKDG